MENTTVLRTMLLDYYGGLLTEKQRSYFDMHFNDDLSLYEIAEQSGVSRQAVWDIIRRAEATLNDAEEKIGLVARALHRREVLAETEKLLDSLAPECAEDGRERLKKAQALLKELED